MVAVAERLKRSVWIATGTMSGDVKQYSLPVLHKWNYRGLSVNVGLAAFGPEFMDYRRAVTTNAEVENLKAFDRAWLETTPSDTDDPMAGDANFYITGITRGVGGIAEVLFKRLSNE